MWAGRAFFSLHAASQAWQPMQLSAVKKKPCCLLRFGLVPTAGSLEVGYHGENPYQDGTLVRSDGTFSGPRPGDLVFTIEIAPDGRRSTSPSSWGAVKELYR